MDELVIYRDDKADPGAAAWLAGQPGVRLVQGPPEPDAEGPFLRLEAESLFLTGGGQALRADFTNMLPRISWHNLSHELLIKAAKIKAAEMPLTVIDATAGLGEDSFLLAAAGFSVRMYERNPVIALMLGDALRRASADPELAEAAARMQLFAADSLTALPQLTFQPDVVFLDPMFPSRQKSALIKKKFQLLQQLEQPCLDEEALLQAALAAGPRRIVIKRPLRGPFLAGRKPDYTIRGNSIRYDCLVLPG